MQYQTRQVQLNNGSRLIHVTAPDLPISMVSAWFPIGSRQDPDGKEGMAHLLEHLFMKRTNRYPDAIGRLKTLESSGIQSNAYTSYETTHFYHIQKKEETYTSLELLLDGLESRFLDTDDVEREKGIVINELLEHISNPGEYVWNISNQAVWKHSTLGRNFFGTKESVASITQADLETFMQKHYSQENCTFVVISDDATEEITHFLNEKSTSSAVRAKGVPERAIFEKPEKLSIVALDTDQITIAVAFRTCSINHDQNDLAGIDFIRDYLANKWISRLIEELRLKKDITYWVNGISVNFSDTGVLRFTFSCDKKNVAKSLDIISREIEKLHSDAFLDVDLAHFKKSFASSLAIRFTDPYEYLWWFGWQTTVSRDKSTLLSVERYAELVQNLSNEAIQRIARTYLTKETVSISLIGNITREELGGSTLLQA